MFGSMKNLLSYLAGDAGPRVKSEGYTRWLVTAALLTRAATVHREMSEARRKALYSVLQSSFGLDDHTTARVIKNLPRSIITQLIFIISLASSMKSSTMRVAIRSFE
jgi:uncharacterized tellurite resistance protein B-like protein